MIHVCDLPFRSRSINHTNRSLDRHLTSPDQIYVNYGDIGAAIISRVTARDVFAG